MASKPSREKEDAVKIKFYHRAALVAAVAVTAFWAVPISAAADDSMAIMLEKVQADKKAFIASHMTLTASETRAFWPVYDDYQAEVGQLELRSERLFNAYREAYPNLTDRRAKDFMNEFLAIESQFQAIRQSFLPRFREALAEKKVFRYYQIENRIRAVRNFQLARTVPAVQ